LVFNFLLPVFTQEKELNKEIITPKTSKETKQTNSSKEKNQLAAIISLGTGRGELFIGEDKFDIYSSPTDFVSLALLGASLTSFSTANTLAGNLNLNTYFTVLALNSQLRNNYYQAKSNSVLNRFYIENRDKVHDTSYQFGLTSSYHSFSVEESKYYKAIVPGLLTSFSSPLLNQYVLFNYNQLSQPIYTNISTFDFVTVKHLLPDETIDLYIGAGLGLGGCLVECRAAKGLAKGGIRSNFSKDFFAFIELEFQVLFLFSNDRKYTPLFDRNILFGIGHNF
jgi:hypothetical protein